MSCTICDEIILNLELFRIEILPPNFALVTVFAARGFWTLYFLVFEI